MLMRRFLAGLLALVLGAGALVVPSFERPAARAEGIDPTNPARVLRRIGGKASPPVAVTPPDPGYYSISGTGGASGGYCPDAVIWAGIKAFTSSGCSDYDDVRHALKLSSEKLKFRAEIQNTTHDRRAADLPTTRRRSEFSFNQVMMSEGVRYCGAFTVLPETYADPTGMATTATLSGLLFQVKGDEATETAAKSANIGWRRTNTDGFAISTVGGTDQSQGTTRYSDTWTRDTTHDIVWCATLHDTAGTVEFWLDGAKIVDLTGIPTAPTPFGAGSYIKVGAYHSGGIGPNSNSVVSNQFANFVLPTSDSAAITALMDRVSSPPAWPTD